MERESERERERGREGGREGEKRERARARAGARESRERESERQRERARDSAFLSRTRQAGARSIRVRREELQHITTYREKYVSETLVTTDNKREIRATFGNLFNHPSASPSLPLSLQRRTRACREEREGCEKERGRASRAYERSITHS
jgi:hypothetical protein